MEAKDIVAKEIAKQLKFGYKPSFEDMVIAGEKQGIEKGRREGLQGVIAYLENEIARIDQRTAGVKSFKALEKAVLQAVINDLKERMGN